MGAFLLLRRPTGLSVEEMESLHGESIGVFAKKGLQLNQRIVTSTFVVYVFHKYRFQSDNVVHIGNDQFVAGTGTCMYKGRIGASALRELHDDFSESGAFLSDVSGNYCLIVAKNGRLYVLNDYTGLYYVYCDRSRNIFSSSLVAVAKSLEKKRISPQEFYEYVINGAYYGDRTPVEDVDLIDSRSILQLSPELSAIPKTPGFLSVDGGKSFDKMLQAVSNDLVQYFETLKTNFGDSVCSALTGGFDTRLLLAVMRKVGISPYLYVYGDKNSSDVRIATQIARGEGLEIDCEDGSDLPKLDEEEFERSLERQYYLLDGLGHEYGVFDNGMDLCGRLKRTEKARLQLNGGGGGLFRDFWVLPDKSLRVESFLKSKYDFMDYSVFSPSFDKTSYFKTFANKIRLILDTTSDRIDRRQIAMLLPSLHLKYWMGNNNSLNNQFAYMLTPYADTRFVTRALDIPLRYRQLGVFQAALIKHIDPDLARYGSQYGFDFYRGVGFSARARHYFKVRTPTAVRPYVRRHLLYPRKKGSLPAHLTRGYLERVFDLDDLQVSKYVNVNRIDDPELLSRVLSVELLVTDRF